MVPMPSIRLTILIVLTALLAGPAAAGEPPVPDYRVPDGLAPGDDPRIEELVESIVSETGTGREDAWKVLAGLRAPAVPAVVDGLSRAAPFPRALLMYAIAESGEPAVASVLLAGAKDPAWAVREAAANGLSRSEAPGTVDALTALLADSSWRVRAAAALSLRRLVSRGRADRERVVAALMPLAGDFDDDVRFAAIRALGNLRAERAIPLFVRGYLESREEERRTACLSYLTHLDSARDDLVPALERAMQSSDDGVFLTAAEKYAELTGPKLLGNEGHVYRILSLLRKGSDTVVASIRIARVLRNVGPKAVPVLLADLERVYSTPSRPQIASDLSATVLDISLSILKEDAAPVLTKIMVEWEVTEARRHAIRLARRYHAKELAPVMMRLFFEPGTEPLRTELLRAIAAADPEDLERFLDHAVLSGAVYLQQVAFEILRERRDVELTGSLAAALSSEDEHPRIATNWLILLESRDRVLTWKLSRRLLAHPNPAIRQVGARWVFTAPEVSDALELLTTAFAKEDGRHRERDTVDVDTARYQRANILGTILSWSGKRAGTQALPLFSTAMKDGDPVVRERALEALTHVDDPRALDLALAALETETDATIRRQALRSVVRSKEPRARDVVNAALAGASERDRLQVLSALDTMEDSNVPAAIATALAEGKWEPAARVRAVMVLSRRGAPGDAALLGRLAVKDPDFELRQEAVRALAESGDPEVVGALAGLLPAEDADLVKLPDEARLLALDAIHGLGVLGAEEAVPPLLRLFDREWELAVTSGASARSHFDAVVQLLLALGRIGDERAIPPLLERLLSPGLYRDVDLITENPAEGERNLLTALIGALVRFPDRSLAREAEVLKQSLIANFDLLRIPEGYLRHVARVVADPRRGGIRQPRPRRAFAAVLDRAVVRVIPRDSANDLSAMESLAWHEAAASRYHEAHVWTLFAVDLRPALYPLDFAEKEAYYRARGDFLRGLATVERVGEKEGLAIYETGLARDPDDPQVLNLYAWWLAKTGRNLDRAREAALAAGRRSATDANILDTLGWVLFRRGETKEAVARLAAARAIELRREDPSVGRYRSPLILFHLAAALAADGRLDASRRILTEAIVIDDTMAGAARASAWFAPLREEGTLAKTIDDALSSIPR
ncbi:MAG: HEAT repeat domain-containing protein [Planctomycetota bacterium]